MKTLSHCFEPKHTCIYLPGSQLGGYICNYFAGKIRFITFPSNINQAIFSHLKLFPSCQLTQLMT